MEKSNTKYAITTIIGMSAVAVAAGGIYLATQSGEKKHVAAEKLQSTVEKAVEKVDEISQMAFAPVNATPKKGVHLKKVSKVQGKITIEEKGSFVTVDDVKDIEGDITITSH